MLAVFLDANNEVREIGLECEVMKRKMQRFSDSRNVEDRDSHVRAIAGCIHGIYTGMEKALKNLVRYFDSEVPTGEDWHVQLLLRARYPNEGIRPSVISEETFRALDSLRGFRHIFRGRYHTNLVPELVIQRANETLVAFNGFVKDLRDFEQTMDGTEALDRESP